MMNHDYAPAKLFSWSQSGLMCFLMAEFTGDRKLERSIERLTRLLP